MSTHQTPAAVQEGEATLPAAGLHPEPTFEELMRRPGATLDNAVDVSVIGAYGLEWDGCRTCMGSGVVDDGDRLCPECRPVKR